MAIEIRDFGNAFDWRDTTTGIRKTFSKQSCQIGLDVTGSEKRIYLADSRSAISFAFADVTLPVTADIEALYFNLQRMLRRTYPSYGAVKYFRSAANLNPLGATPENFIVVDLSDTVNYPQEYSTHIEIQNITIIARASAVPVPGTADLAFKLGFLENVDGTDGDLFTFHREGFSLAASEQITKHYDFGSNPIVLDTAKYVTADKSLNDTAFNTALKLRATIDPTTADTAPGNGDLVGVITFWDSGQADIDIQIGYNTY